MRLCVSYRCEGVCVFVRPWSGDSVWSRDRWIPTEEGADWLMGIMNFDPDDGDDVCSFCHLMDEIFPVNYLKMLRATKFVNT